MVKNISKFDSLGYYEVLECSPNSTEEELRAKYRELAKFWHPDQNKDPKAVDMFQKIAVAYEVLKNPIDRLKYNLLSIVYKKEDFPQMDALSVIKSVQGKEDLNLRALRLIEVTGKGFGYSKIDKIYYCTQNEAKWVVKQITKHNWLYGFLGLKAIFANFGAICKNFSNLNNPKENLKLFIHNAIAYSLENRDKDAVTSLAIAKEFADKDEIYHINKYMESFGNVFPFSVGRWNFSKLKQIQCMYFLGVILAFLFVYCAILLMQIETDRKSVQSVKEEVIFRDGSRAFSDVAVARILDIPVDVRDTKRLYHVITTTEALHGADKSFDVYKTVEEGTTVRITGQTTDNKWLRVMFDNGEMAFIEADKLRKGIGKDIPLWSKIYKDE